MKTTCPKFFAFAFAFSTIALSISSWLAAAQTVNSRWKDQEIKIDGAAGE